MYFAFCYCYAANVIVIALLLHVTLSHDAVDLRSGLLQMMMTKMNQRHFTYVV